MNDRSFIETAVEGLRKETVKLAEDIWGYAELSYEETRSSSALASALEGHGFAIEKNIAKMPTAFMATYARGTGKPVIGFLGEYDALDMLSQKAASPIQCPVKEGGAGHGCGHNLLGTGAYAAAVATKQWLDANGLDGTVVYFGCPAEEGAGAKQFMARAGVFDGVDMVFTWHPDTINTVQSEGNVAIMGANFTFTGTASHAGGAPHLGRSALDACELMNVGVNYLREHMIDRARIHYAYSDAGGTAPNVVPAHAVIKYEVRAPKVAQMKELFERVVNVAKGAALMTETTLKYEVTMAFSDYTPNRTLAKIAGEAFLEIGAPEWTEEDIALAAQFLRTYPRSTQKDIEGSMERYFENGEFSPEAAARMLERPLDARVHPFRANDTSYDSGSTDVGDVGYAAPTVNVLAATASIGTVAHSWQNTAQANSAIGMKGMLTAAKVMALAAATAYHRPEEVLRAKEELLIKNGGKYTCPLPDYVEPPIGRY